MKLTLLTLYVSGVVAFPWVAEQPGVDTSLLTAHRRLRTRQQAASGPGGPATCPFNPNHVAPVPISDKFPYGGAKNGIAGSGKGGYMVPDPNDPDHQYIAPTAQDIRGPCPGLNAAANHGFLARDGITTFNELIDGIQNVYNLGWDLSVFIAACGLTITDGDLTTERLSIGCDATTRTSINPLLTGSEPGLDGHNHFEADSSLTRADYFLNNGDNFSFNTSLWQEFVQTTGGNFNFAGIAKYRYQRYWESRNTNPNFYFGPLSLLLYGASGFVYNGFPNGLKNYTGDLETISTFFGASQQSDGSWKSVPERIPERWTNRVSPLDLYGAGVMIVSQYKAYPVAFGGNAGLNNFQPLSFGAIQNGTMDPEITVADTLCLLYQLLTTPLQSGLNVIITPTVETLNFVAKKVAPAFQNLGCPLPES